MGMAKYKCKKPLNVSMYEDVGFYLFAEVTQVEAGSVWQVSGGEYRYATTKNPIRLNKVETEEENWRGKWAWVEVCEEELNNHFESVE